MSNRIEKDRNDFQVFNTDFNSSSPLTTGSWARRRYFGLRSWDITLGGKVQNIPMKTEHGMQLLQHWVDTMLGSFIATFADRRVLKAKPPTHD
ncbi:hypothetical protein DdX_20988 [Ditylenchus destructor]|uniref:Uncharacterized protein n=1 Tax=Ditylenchus destructor TaxID=166010 RepID=A0AAD4MHY5_9BILA|nr:hypothetical protein DdX_20988 [Ditylenchus destructor]